MGSLSVFGRGQLSRSEKKLNRSTSRLPGKLQRLQPRRAGGDANELTPGAASSWSTSTHSYRPTKKDRQQILPWVRSNLEIFGRVSWCFLVAGKRQAAKSTLAKIITGLYPPRGRAEIRLNGPHDR